MLTRDSMKSKGSLILTCFLASFVLCFGIFWAIIAYYSHNYRPQYAVLFDTKKVSSAEIKKFNQAKDYIINQFYTNVNQTDLIEGAIAGMTSSLNDPYTMYLNKDQMALLASRTEGQYVGIGVYLLLDKDGLLNVVDTFENSPARKSGIEPGDKIIKVNDTDVTSIQNEDIVIKMIKGPEKTSVKITIFRPSTNKYIDFNLIRKQIKIDNIKSEVLENSIGYIKIITFDEQIAKSFHEHLNALKAQSVKSLIIDVRDNPGGIYSQVLAIANELLPKCTIVYTEDRNGNKQVEKSDDNYTDLPITILINQNSASASEILAGAIKDNSRGALIGTKTFGKGVIQKVYTFPDSSGMTITIARYFTPSGVCIHNKGIEPNFEVTLPYKYTNIPISKVPRKDDSQLQKAIEYLKSKQGA